MTDLTMRRVFRTWLPLGLSWLLMGIELPAMSAVMARLPTPNISLAAYGGVVFPIALVIEAPIIMLLSASTALSKDWASYLKLRRFMWVSGVLLTAVHILVAFTPLYYILAERVIGAPQEIVEPARIGLMIMTPWTLAIASRRFNQGVLIRFGHAGAVGAGSALRLTTAGIILFIGYWLGDVAGIVVASVAQACGVIVEGIFARWMVRPVLRNELRSAPKAAPLTWRAFGSYYTPLVFTSLLTFLWMPIASAGISRMYLPLASLAVQPVIGGLAFMMRSMGFAYQEVVVALLDTPHSSKVIRRFAGILAVSTVGLHFFFVATPLSLFWFLDISNLEPALAEMSQIAFWILLPVPALATLQSWYQGAILVDGRTRGIPESLVVFMLTAVVILGIGIVWNPIAGIYTAMIAFTAANLTQTMWLWYRSRHVMGEINLREELTG
jgi:hypothetical protein